MKTPRYLIAKYIPDLGRMEPRNVGVIVWSPDGVEARFLAERADRPGEVDGRSIPAFVTSPPAYQQWVSFWRAELARPAIEPLRGRDKVSRGSPGFLDALQSSGRGNFVLAEGGFLLDPVAAEELPRLADRLFAALVEAAGPEELPRLADRLFAVLVEAAGPEDPRDPSLDELCERLIAEAGLAEDANFRTRHEVVCPVAPGTEERFEFSYAYQDGSLRRLYQRVPLPREKAPLRKSVHDAAWMFEKVITAGIIRPEQGAVLVNATPELKADPEVERSLKVLGSVTRVLNLHDYDRAKAEFLALRELTSP
jgi:hypothetical protein